MKDPDALVRYGDAWNEDDAEARLAHLKACLTDDALYCDPTVELRGPGALSDHIGQTRAAFGGYRIDRTSGFEEHHGYGRFAWQMTSDEGQPIVDGIDVIRMAADGRLATIVGFFGPFPERV